MGSGRQHSVRGRLQLAFSRSPNAQLVELLEDKNWLQIRQWVAHV